MQNKKKLLRNWLYRSRKVFALLTFFCLQNAVYSQFANYVLNGSFENKTDCLNSNELNKAIGWNSIGDDTNKVGGLLYATDCFFNAPTIPGIGFQYPKNGTTFFRLQNFCTHPCSYDNSRGYPKNRLKSKLQSNKVYCVKMYAVLQNESPLGTDGIGFYFADSSIDTIKKCNSPLFYLTPQVQNPNGNVILDTLNWIPITGTFVATGNEKYLVIGNFKSDAATVSSVAISTSTQTWSEYFIDAVSCIEMDAPAYAGADKYIISGQSTYLGRELDFAVDPYCYWYQMPGMVPLDTASGITVSPTVTTTYVVRQELECNSIKWDTVVVRVGYTGFAELSDEWLELSVYPSPADEILNVEFTSVSSGQYSVGSLQSEVGSEQLEACVFEIINSLGQVIREEELQFKEGKATIDIKDLESGVYVMTLSLRGMRSLNSDSSFVGMTRTSSKRFVVNH